MAPQSQITGHAKLRCQQRGISPSTIRLLLQHGDVITPVGGGRRAITVSRLERAAMANEGVCPQTLDRIRKLCLIEEGQRIITVMVATQRRYRHGVKPRRRY